MAFDGHVIVLYGLLWQNLNLIGLVSSFLAVINLTSFGLVSLNFKKYVKKHLKGHSKLSKKAFSILLEHLYNFLKIVQRRWKMNEISGKTSIVAHFIN